jgi:methylmalonyl-CoA/ethylmalonyl-CoA epimerase
MNSCFSHIALLVPSVDKSAQFLNAKGIETNKPEIFESEGTKEIYVGSYDSSSGLLLLLEAISDGPYKKAMAKRGPSLHHIAMDVLDIESFVAHALLVGWKLHPVTQETIKYNTAWLYLKGVPTLIEVHQKKKLSILPNLVSMIDLPIENDQMPLFEQIGLGGVISTGKELCLTVSGQSFKFTSLI